jgi:hypothetical protein
MAFGDFTVTRASTKLRIGSDGLYGSVANNVPAFEFNTDGSYRGLLVEPGATNLHTHSQAVDDVIWLKSGVTVTSNATTAPDGTVTADKMVSTASSSTIRRVEQNFSATSGTTYTVSAFFKASEWGFAFFNAPEAVFTTREDCFLNLSTGVLSGGGASFGRVQALPNGWYRLSYTRTATATATTSFRFGVSDTASTSSAGDGTSGIFIWQAQLETGSVATSPIVTTAGTASRVGDVITLSSASSLIGQTEGTVFAEVNVSRLGVEGYILRVDDGSTSNIFSIRKLTTNEIRAVLTATTSSGTVNLSSATVTTGVVKIAYAYKSGEIAISVNGVAPVTVAGTFSFGTALSRISVGANAGSGEWNDTIRSFALFPTRLANATLQSLTS